MGVRDAVDVFDLRNVIVGTRERVPVLALDSCLVLRKTVCGTTESFCSSIFPMTFKLMPVSGSELRRDAKLDVALASLST